MQNDFVWLVMLSDEWRVGEAATIEQIELVAPSHYFHHNGFFIDLSQVTHLAVSDDHLKVNTCWKFHVLLSINRHDRHYSIFLCRLCCKNKTRGFADRSFFDITTVSSDLGLTSEGSHSFASRRYLRLLASQSWRKVTEQPVTVMVSISSVTYGWNSFTLDSTPAGETQNKRLCRLCRLRETTRRSRNVNRRFLGGVSREEDGVEKVNKTYWKASCTGRVLLPDPHNISSTREDFLPGSSSHRTQ